MDPEDYYHIREFDSPDLPFSGERMDSSLIKKLLLIRKNIGYGRINSGFRTTYHNRKAGGAEGSAHTMGLAVDISARTNEQRFDIVHSAIMSGVKRIGIGRTFIHIDVDTTKQDSIIWLY